MDIRFNFNGKGKLMDGEFRLERLVMWAMPAVVVLVVICGSCFGEERGWEKGNRYAIKIPGGTYKYRIEVGGTLDEFNTADYPGAPLGASDVGHKRLESRFQPNNYVSIENIGDKDVVNPRIVINGRRNWYSAEDILSGIVKPGMTTEEKAMAIWRFVADIEQQCHENDRRVDNGSITINKELTNPVKWSNSYYCSGCQFAASVICILCQKAGIPADDTRTVGLGGAHRIAEVRWDGDWHVLDGDERMFHLEKDNKTPASIADIGEDIELCDRTHGGGFASCGLTKKRGVQYRDLEKKITQLQDIDSYLSTMAMTLRPGEKIVWRWDNIGKYRCGDNDRNIKPNRPEGLMPYQLANGKMIYRPRFDGQLFEKGVYEVSNIQAMTDESGKCQLRVVEPGKAAYVIYKISTAYPVVGGLIGGEFFMVGEQDLVRFYVSVYEPNDFKQVLEVKGDPSHKGQPYEMDVSIDEVLNPKPNPAIYNYYVKCELFAKESATGAVANSIFADSDLQMSGTALPSLSVGVNNIVYTDDSGEGGMIEVTHDWKESSFTNPPSAPADSVEPADGSTVSPKKARTLSWQAAEDSDGNISDYHIQVSARKDMLYPVSPNFDRIIFSALPTWSVPSGWLNPGQTYYWRVRAKDNWGTWGDWSKVWSFTIEGSE
jgi:hypothetical protein